MMNLALTEMQQERLDDAYKECNLRMKEKGCRYPHPESFLIFLLIEIKPEQALKDGIEHFGSVFEDIINDKDLVKKLVGSREDIVPKPPWET